jgi:tRNA threonylcarbamoyladenosine biosynthesis protein TsaB
VIRAAGGVVPGSITLGFRAPEETLLILSLDTTTRAGSVALVRDDTVVAQLTGDPALTHSQRLPAELMRVLEAARVALAQIDLLAVAAGPGSFTGLRVGIASMQGLAFATGLKIVPVPTLEALARETERLCRDDDTLIAPWVDAHRGEVFAALYDVGLRAVLEIPSSAAPDATLEAWRPALGSRSVVFGGDGAVRYRGTIAAALGPQARVLETVPPLAGIVGRIAAANSARAVLPHAVVPVYVRRSDAELTRDRRASSSR